MTGRKMVAAAVVLGMFMTGAARADEVTDQITEGLSLYKSGKLSQAAAELELAVQQIKSKQSGEVVRVLPAALAGWKEQAAESSGGGMGVLSGASASKRYTKDGASKQDGDASEAPEVRIEILSDSPMLAGMLAMFSNPMILASQGGRLVKVKGYKALVKTDGDSPSLQIVVAAKALVTVNGSGGATESDVIAYANAIDITQLESMLK